MLGGAAIAVPIAELQPVGAEASALEVRRDSKYLLVLKFPWPLQSQVHQRLGDQLEHTLCERGLRNVTALILDHEAECELYRLDSPADTAHD